MSNRSPLVSPPSRSTSRARPGLGATGLVSRAHSIRSIQLMPQGGGEELINPDGQVGAEAVHLLGEFVTGDSSRVRREEEHGLLEEEGEVDDDDNDSTADEREEWSSLPWYKRPSPWWFIGTTPVVALALSTCVAARVQLYNQLACRDHKPEYSLEIGLPLASNLNSNFSASTYWDGASNTTIDFPFSSQIFDYQDSNSEQSKWGLIKIPQPSSRCLSDPEVQAAVAQLIAALGTSMGILATLTTAFWSQLSDRYGRRLVMGIAVFGTLVGDAVVIAVSQTADSIPGGYRLLLVGPIFDGLLGGITTALAAYQAYIADCTEAHTRARYFSLAMGLIFMGFGIGPSIGGYVVRRTGDLLSVFYIATTAHFLYACVVWFLVPESLSKRKMMEAKIRYKEASGVHTPLYNRMFVFLRPLALFFPKMIEVKGQGLVRDWNLTLLGGCSAMLGLITSSYSYKFLYASSNFGWDTEKLGYWLSIVGFTRAFHLMIVLPIIFRLFKPKALTRSVISEQDPLIASSAAAAFKLKSLRFDLILARVSLVIDLVSYTMLILVRTPLLWTIGSMIGAFGGGYAPAMQSVALEVYMRRGETEVGKLFGALSVLQSVASQIIGPTLFGLVYVASVTAFPQAIFALAAAAIFLALCCNLLIKLRPTATKENVTSSHVRSNGSMEHE